MSKTIGELDAELQALNKWLLETMIPELHVERLKAKQLVVEEGLQATGAMREGDQPLSAKYQAKGDARVLEETIKGLQAELAQTRTELAQMRATLNQALDQVRAAAATAQATANQALQTANNAATKAELGNYLPKSGGVIGGDLTVKGQIWTVDLTVGNIHGHGNQGIHMPGGQSADNIYLNWNEHKGSVYIHGEYLRA